MAFTRRSVRFGSFIAILCLMMCLTLGEINAQTPQKLTTLTLLLPQSGRLKTLGENVKNGFFLGIKQESAALNVDLAEWVKFTLVDSQGNAEHALAEVKNAVQDGSQAIMGIVASGVGLGIADYVLNEAQIPLFVFGAGGTPKLRTTNPLFLRTSFSAHQSGIGLAQWLSSHPLKPSTPQARWACIHTDNQIGIDVCEGFKLGYQEYGEEIGRVPVPAKAHDKKKYLVQLAKIKPNFTLVYFSGIEMIPFVQDYYRFGMHKTAPMIMSGDYFTPQALTECQKTLSHYNTALGITFATRWLASLDNPANQAFMAQYQQAYASSPSSYAVYAYDAGRLLVKALAELRGEWESAAVMQAMRTQTLISPRHGRQLQFDSHGDPINPVYISVTEQQDKQIVKRLIGEMPLINQDEYLQTTEE